MTKENVWMVQKKSHFQSAFKYCQNCITSNPVRSSRLGLVFDITRYILHCRIPMENSNHSSIFDSIGNSKVWFFFLYLTFILGNIFGNQWYYVFQKYNRYEESFLNEYLKLNLLIIGHDFSLWAFWNSSSHSRMCISKISNELSEKFLLEICSSQPPPSLHNWSWRKLPLVTKEVDLAVKFIWRLDA